MAQMTPGTFELPASSRHAVGQLACFESATMPPGFLLDGPERAPQTILLAHGAGAPMDSPSMNAIARTLADAGLRVARFEFGYMARRRDAGTPTPPPRAEALVPEFHAALAELDAAGPLIIGGKSMGGRVASMIADELHHSGAIVGLLCLGYPFHPQGKPERLRMAHLATLQTPTLICQGTRDPLGNRDEAAGYMLSKKIEVLWLEDGDHDLKPRKSVTGLTAADHLKTIGEVVRQWAGQFGP